MIPVRRGTEPRDLVEVRGRELPELRQIAKKGRVVSMDIRGYQRAAGPLWKRQHHKCCYCETRVFQHYNDVEHYRPKGAADRLPGSTETHGYWWLAFDWNNLLFACSLCNRSEKNDAFPLTPGDVALQPEEQPPGRERPYLLDPSGAINPVDHIEFEYRYALENEPRALLGPKQWFARARDGSQLGHWTIFVLGLNNGDLVELRGDHVESCVRGPAERLKAAVVDGNGPRVKEEFEAAKALLRPACYFVALTYDALRLWVPNATLAPWDLKWPEPGEVGLPPRNMPIRRPASRTTR
ncbi:MAG: hypothetical protein IPK82_17960 [Polyangiaceae bacterium]|nr:hypothetical protein [Polyangiaceae bacterium]